MVTRIITFLATKTGLSGLAIEVILAVAAVGAGFWMLKVHDARIYSEAHIEGTKAGVEQMRVEKEKEWVVLQKSINDALSKNKEYIAELEGKNARLIQERVELENRIDSVKSKVVERLVEIPIKVNQIPPNALTDSIITRSNTLAGLPTDTSNHVELLNEKESRLVVMQLDELSVRRQQVIDYEGLLKQQKEQNGKDVALCSEQIKLINERDTLLEKEKNAAVERANFYEDAYKITNKGRSFKCTMAKIFTLGMAKCR